MINIHKRNNLYEYRFEAGKVNGKRKQISKSKFKTKEMHIWQDKEPMKNILKKVQKRVI